MTTTPEEEIKKLNRKVSNLEKQVQDIIKNLKIIQERTDHPRRPGWDYPDQPKRPGRR